MTRQQLEHRLLLLIQQEQLRAQVCEERAEDRHPHPARGSPHPSASDIDPEGSAATPGTTQANCTDTCLSRAFPRVILSSV